MTRVAAVTGANGFVGSHLCRELLTAGWQVRALHRPRSDIATLAGLPIELRSGDITDRDSLLSAFKGVDCVFHIAALFRQAKFPDQVYHDVNVGGVENVFSAAREVGVPRVIHCSTVGVHSHIPNPPASENEAYRPGDIYQETKCLGEQAALAAFRAGSIGGVVIRPAMIWGPGDRRLAKLFQGIARRRMPLIGSGQTLVHWVLVTDLARAFRLAAENIKINGEVFIISGRRAVTMRQLYEGIATAVGSKVLPIRVPALPLQVLGDVVEKICIPFGWEPPIYRRRVDFYTKTRSFDWSKAKRLLGYQPAQDFDDEVQLIASWYREQGWL